MLLRAAGFSFEAGCLSDIGSSVCPMGILTQSTGIMASVEQFASPLAAPWLGAMITIVVTLVACFGTERFTADETQLLTRYCSIAELNRGSYDNFLPCWPRYPLTGQFDSFNSNPATIDRFANIHLQKTIKLLCISFQSTPILINWSASLESCRSQLHVHEFYASVRC